MTVMSFFLVGCLVGIAAPVFAQTGEIAGVVRDNSGGVLPGVTVEASSPALIEKVRTAQTDGQGLYKIVDLRPGVYTVTFTLTGFSTVRREGIELTTAFTATVNAEMQVGAIAETITVSGSAPLVDAQNTRQQKVFTSDLIETLPTSKNFRNIAVLIPGVITTGGYTGQDVGGSTGEAFSLALSVHGSRAGDAPMLFDGMRYNNLTASGLYSTMVINTGVVQEMEVQVGGMSAESETSGVRVNVVPKDGGNRFSGLLATSYANDKMQAANINDALRAAGVSAFGVQKTWDVNPAVGGPIRTDRMWFYGSFRHWGTNAVLPGSFYAVDRLAFTYTPDKSQPGVDDRPNKAENLRVTWQASRRNKVTLYGAFDQRCVCHINLSSTITPEASQKWHGKPSALFQGSWSSTVSNRLLLEAGVSVHPEKIFHQRQPYVTPDTYSVLELSTNITFRAAPTYFEFPSTVTSTKFSASYVTGSHAFKTGLATMNGCRSQYTYANQDTSLRTLNGVPNGVTVYATPYGSKDCIKQNISLFTQDQWKKNRLTLNLGLRFDYFNGYVPAQHLAATRWVPFEQDFAPVYDAPNLKDLSPRLGAVYDVFGNGKTAVKFNVGEYLEQIGTQYTSRVDPVNLTVTSATRNWTDNGDWIPQENELGPLSNVNFGKPGIVTTHYDDELTRGWGKRANDWEVSGGIAHEIMHGLSVTATYNNHWFNNLTVTQNLLTTPADYDQFCITAPLDSRLPGGGGNQICGLYDLKPEKFGLVNNQVRFANYYGDRIQRYTGVDVAAIARLPHSIVLQGGTSTGRIRNATCFVVNSPGDMRFCDDTPPYLTQLKFFAVYPLPWWGLRTSATYQSLPGVPISASYVATNAEIAPTLGRNLGSCRGSATCNGNVTIPLIAPDTLFGDRMHQVDFRLGKTIRVGRTRVEAQFDLYNLANSNAVLAINSRFGPAWLNPTQVLPGRLAKVGAQLTF
jgi:hypothetical protein